MGEQRDFEKAPYTEDERKVASFFSDIGVGGGDDPIGSLIASHRELARQRNILKTRLADAGMSTDVEEVEEPTFHA